MGHLISADDPGRVASGRRALLYLGLLFQTVAWPIMVSEDLLWSEAQTSTSLLPPISQCLLLIYLAWRGPSLVGKISFSDHGEEISKFSSGMAFVVGYWYSFAGSALLFPLLVLAVSAHHSLVGFSMDKAWRRGFGLVGIPAGFLVAVPPDAGLLFPVMLFAAALSLIGQAVLYASRGGMGIGTAKEGSESVVEPIGIGRNIGSDSDSGSIETDDEIGGREPDGQSGEEVDMERNESQEGEPDRCW